MSADRGHQQPRWAPPQWQKTLAAMLGPAMEDASSCTGIDSGHGGCQQPCWAQSRRRKTLAATLDLAAGDPGSSVAMPGSVPCLEVRLPKVLLIVDRLGLLLNCPLNNNSRQAVPQVLAVALRFVKASCSKDVCTPAIHQHSSFMSLHASDE
ncbi:UNVERIFIED_CONTAM: hypothetical protein K2H54_049120 [Gekko kuhli]